MKIHEPPSAMQRDMNVDGESREPIAQPQRGKMFNECASSFRSGILADRHKRNSDSTVHVGNPAAVPSLKGFSRNHGHSVSINIPPLTGLYRLIFVVIAAILGTSSLPARYAKALTQSATFTERAYQDREILYELQAPDTHAFRITHDYTVGTAGERYYFNIVRAGSHVTNPESIDLDSGENLKWETITGKTARERKLAVGEVKDDTEIVVTHLARPLAAGTTNRIRLKETYVDAKSLYLDGDELVWDRSFGRLRNTVVLPPGWYLTALSSPATIQTLADGRVSVYIVNPRNDDVRVYLRARPRAGAKSKPT